MLSFSPTYLISGICVARALCDDGGARKGVSVMADALLLAVAAALAGKAAEVAIDGGRSAWGALVRLVRDRLHGDDAAQATLATAGSQPNDQAIAALVAALERAAAADAGFGVRLRELWPQAQAELSARENGVVNVAGGTVGGHLVQARDLRVEGGVRLGDVHSADGI